MTACHECRVGHGPNPYHAGDCPKLTARIRPRWRVLRMLTMGPLIPFIAAGRAATLAFDWLDWRLR